MLMLLLDPGTTLFLAFTPWFLLPPVAAVAVNRTIDDSFGDSVTGQHVSYLPSTDTWDDQTCGTKCLIHPDVSQAFRGTYTAGTYYPPDFGPISITMQFTGTAIYVFCILVNNDGGTSAITLTVANFTLDRTSPQLFQHNPNLTTSDFEYNRLVFKRENLDNANHTLVISSSGPTKTFINFDYAIYTFEDDTIPPSPPAPPVVGGSGLTTATLTPDQTVSSDSRATPTTSTSSTASDPVITNGSSATAVTTMPSNISAATTSTSESGGNSKTHVPTGVLVGGVIGGLAIVAPIIFIVHRLSRNHSKATEDGRSFPYSQHVVGISPFILHPTSSSTAQLTDRHRDPLVPAHKTSPIPFHSSSRSDGSLGVRAASGGPLDSDHDRLLVRAQRRATNENGRNSEELREQLNTLREQITYLQIQRCSSELEQSISDAPPPAYYSHHITVEPPITHTPYNP